MSEADPGEIRRLFEGLAGVAFDFDGVLVDSVDVKTQAFLALYAEESEEFRAEVVRYHLAFGGVSRREKLAHYERLRTGEEPNAERIEHLATRFADLVKDRVIAAPEMPGAQELLEFLSPRLSLFVCSGTPEDELQEIILARGWSGYFTRVHGAPMTKTAMLDDIASRLGCTPEELLMVGDATTDREAARASRTRFLFVADGGDACAGRPMEARVAHPQEVLGALSLEGS